MRASAGSKVFKGMGQDFFKVFPCKGVLWLGDGC